MTAAALLPKGLQRNGNAMYTACPGSSSPFHEYKSSHVIVALSNVGVVGRARVSIIPSSREHSDSRSAHQLSICFVTTDFDGNRP